MAATNPVKYLLLGKWMGHPLHPAVVHVPIALWMGSLVFDILTCCHVGGNALVRTSYWMILLGLLSTLIVVPAGIAEWTEIRREKPAWKLALWHAALNIVTALILVVSLALRTGRPYFADVVPLVPFLLNVVANVILLVSGYLGGRLVYEHGIAVARMSKQEWRRIAAAGHANLPPEK